MSALTGFIKRINVNYMQQLNDVLLVSVVRNFEMYRNFFERNAALAGVKLLPADNRVENLPIPVRYNTFLDGYDYSQPAWFVFAHEDFEIREPIMGKLADCDCGSLWGVIGGRRRSLFGFGISGHYGSIVDADRSHPGQYVRVGKLVRKGFPVETFDCCALIVHSSLVQRYGLRFDPKLEFDLYVEDFCAMAKVRHGIASRILPFEATHHSLSVPQKRYYDLLPYLRRKYPNNCFTGTCSYIGTMPPMMRFQRWLMGRAEEDRAAGLRD